MLDRLNEEIYKKIIRSAPVSARLKMLRELSRVIANQENTERLIRKRIAYGVPKKTVIGRKFAKIRAKKKLRQAKTQTDISKIFSRLDI